MNLSVAGCFACYKDTMAVSAVRYVDLKERPFFIRDSSVEEMFNVGAEFEVKSQINTQS